MFSQFSVGGRPKSSQRPRVGLTMKVMKDQPQLCFSCEQLFPSRARLEDHCCPAAAFICSCGTEFSDYGDMLTHSNTHEPGHKVLDHKTIVMRRSAHMRHDQEQLRRLAVGAAGQSHHPSQQSMQSAWTLAPPHGAGGAAQSAAALMRGSPYMLSASSSSSVGGKVNARLPALASKVNAMMLPSGSQQPQRPLQAPPAATGSPTADLWTLYQPVVVLKKADVRFNRDARFICAKCDMRFKTRRELTTHHNGTHITDKVFGCIGCGTLLSSKKSVPRYHQCHTSIGSSSSLKMRLITARPFAERKPPSKMSLANSGGVKANNGRIDLTRAHSAASSYRRAAQQQPPRRAAAAVPTRPLQASARMQTEFMLANLANKAPTMIGAGAKNKNGGFTCQICHIDFDALQMLQRHKCAKAREFVEQQLQLGKLPNRFRKLTQPSPSSPSPSLAPAGKVPVYPVLHLNRNGNSKHGLAAPGSMKAAFARPAADGRKALAAAPTTTGAVDDDDDECFIVESSPAVVIAPAVQKLSSPVAAEVQKLSSLVAPVVAAPVAEKISSPVVTAPAVEKISSPVVAAPVAEEITSPMDSAPIVEKISSPMDSAPIVEKITSPMDSAPIVEKISSPVSAPDDPNLSSPVSSEPDVPNLSSPVSSEPDVPNLSSPVSSEPDVPNLSSPVSSEPDVPNLSSPVSSEPDVPNLSSPVSSEPDVPNLSSPVSSEPDVPNLSSPVVTAPDVQNLSSAVAPVAPAAPIVQKFQSLNAPSPTPVQMFQSLNSSLHIVQM